MSMLLNIGAFRQEVYNILTLKTCLYQCPQAALAMALGGRPVVSWSSLFAEAVCIFTKAATLVLRLPSTGMLLIIPSAIYAPPRTIVLLLYGHFWADAIQIHVF